MPAGGDQRQALNRMPDTPAGEHADRVPRSAARDGVGGQWRGLGRGMSPRVGVARPAGYGVLGPGTELGAETVRHLGSLLGRQERWVLQDESVGRHARVDRHHGYPRTP